MLINLLRPSLQYDILATTPPPPPPQLQVPNLPRPERWQLGVSNDTRLVNYQPMWDSTQVGQRVKPEGIQLGAGPVEPWLPYVGFEHRTPDPPSRCCPPGTRRTSLKPSLPSMFTCVAQPFGWLYQIYIAIFDKNLPVWNNGHTEKDLEISGMSVDLLCFKDF